MTKQEPVAWVKDNLICPENGYETTRTEEHPKDLGWTPLYTHPAPSCNGEWSEKIMNQWIDIRKLIADGNTSSYPRDWFESLAPSWQGNKEFVGLSDDEVTGVWNSLTDTQFYFDFAHAIEQALKEKNT